MADYTIEAQARTITGKKVSQVRKSGFVPVTVYGPKVQPLSLQIPYRALEVALLKAGGTTLIDLNVDGATHTVLARQVQRDVIRGTILHVDFFVVDQASVIRTDTPIHFINESPAVTARRGILVTGTNNITIEVLPKNLMHFIEVDLSLLKDVGSSILVGDLKLGPDVRIINDPEEMIVHVAHTSAARSEEDEEALSTSAEPEVIAKGKADEEDF